MKHRLPRLLRSSARFAWAAALLGLPAAYVTGQDATNPFLPPGFGAAAAPPPPASPLDNLEFRAVISFGGKTTVTLRDTSKNPQREFTVDVGDTVNNIRVVNYAVEGEEDRITLESSGKTRQVRLVQPKIVAMAAPPPSAVPLPPGTPPGAGGPGGPAPIVPGQPGGPPAAITQMSDEEVRQRMQRVAEEIRRRRAVRREMLDGSQGAAPTP